MKTKILYLLVVSVLYFGCQNGKETDAFGNFSADEILISAETSGKILVTFFDEGDYIKKGDTLAILDTSTLVLQKMQLLSQKNAISTKFNTIVSEVNVLNEKKSVLEIEKNRVEKLLADSAVSEKQYDDIMGQINIIDQNINATKSANKSIFAEIDALQSQVKLIEKQISNCYIVSPIDGIVLEKYYNTYELCVLGKNIFKIANLDTMKLTAFVSEDQLSSIVLGQNAKVLIDSSDNGYKQYSGKIVWISNTAEFTPKIIQTKKERVNFVYAVKIKVPNDGFLKIGMPADVIFEKE